MAYTSSGELAVGSSYTLGSYVFSLTATPDPGEGTTGINVRCDKDGERARAASEVTGTVKSWSVEANATEASVYVVLDELPDVDYSNTSTCSDTYSHLSGVTVTDNFSGGEAMAYFYTNSTRTSWLCVSAAHYPFSMHRSSTDGTAGDYTAVKNTWQGNDYYCTSHGIECLPGSLFATVPINNNPSGGVKDWAAAMLFGGHKRELLVARFPINIGEAGGGPGGGWTQPGDWNPDPTTTLHLTVNGALSGRHNDPIVDPSFSYLPADNTAQAGYGCGGDGGHGGGGGGGASTVIVRQFATNKANSKDIVALAKRHGYGSGGGKGAKGGDGCILIYY